MMASSESEPHKGVLVIQGAVLIGALAALSLLVTCHLERTSERPNV